MLPASRADAIKIGHPIYFTGKPCKRGHVSERDTVYGYCLVCRKEVAENARRTAREAIRNGGL